MTDGQDYSAILFDKLCTAGETGEELRVEDGADKSVGSFVRGKLCSIVHEKWGKQDQYGIFTTV